MNKKKEGKKINRYICNINIEIPHDNEVLIRLIVFTKRVCQFFTNYIQIFIRRWSIDTKAQPFSLTYSNFRANAFACARFEVF